MQSWVIGLLLLVARNCEGRQLLQAPATAPSSEIAYLDTLRTALDGDKSESGPILYKTFEAAYYSLLVQEGQVTQNGSQIISFGSNSRLLYSWQNSTRALTLAFHTSSQDNSSLTSSVSSLTPWSDFNEIFDGSPPEVNPNALQLFQAAISNGTGIIANLSGGVSRVGRVLCTGWNGGAALAQMCGPWAQINLPASQVRVITFGAPRVGDEKFGYTFEQFVDLPYLWITESDNRTIGQTPSGSLQLPYVTRVISEANYSGAGVRNSIEYYSTLLNNTFKGQSGSIPVVLQSNFSYGYKPRGQNSQFVLSLAPQNGGFFNRVKQIGGQVLDSLSAAGSAISNAFGNLFGSSSSNNSNSSNSSNSSTDDFSGLVDPTAESQGTGSGNGTTTMVGHGGCTPILCKVQPALIQACASYNEGASLGTGSVTVSAEIGTNVALLWNSSTKIATFAFRGTDGGKDWAQNLKLRFSGDTSEGYFSELYNDSRVYSGELEGFRGVTDQAKSDNQSIEVQMNELSGGEKPLQVRCIGHSLGGGLATFCGPWAAEKWPAADIRVVTFGSPKAGNIEFASSVYATVGRIYRVVHSNDAVPSLPPFTRYLHSNFGIYLPGDQAILDDRPPTEISDLTWDAHGCDDQYAPALENVTNITIPAWTESMTASS